MRKHLLQREIAELRLANIGDTIIVVEDAWIGWGGEVLGVYWDHSWFTDKEEPAYMVRAKDGEVRDVWADLCEIVDDR